MVMTDFIENTLSSEQTRIVGAIILLLIIGLDIILSLDEAPGNTPREWILRLTQWNSRFLWTAQGRDGVRWNHWLMPLNYVPMSGAIVPFMLGVLVGHFFHPAEGPPFYPFLGIDGLAGLALVSTIGMLISVGVFVLKRLGVSSRGFVGAIAATGLIVGVLFWPVKRPVGPADPTSTNKELSFSSHDGLQVSLNWGPSNGQPHRCRFGHDKIDFA